ncbi:MAG: phosphoribosylformylglycinamidine cyclo-ligase [Nitrospirae bacterium]|nr:MAG: phosphoribosylformylglycinamidine cyclo-ligase [Nitrospirota bacterium]
MEEKLTYRDAGVDIDEGERFVKLISPLVKETFRKGVLTDIGHFGSLFSLDLKKYPEPVLVSGTDGVGTKLKVAFMLDKHDTVGIDLVAMCVNDIITLGAEPLFFLDYFATGKLTSEQATDVIKGIVKGCKEAQCALIGGETAEMPGFYSPGEYDLSGFAVGVVNRDEIVDGSSIAEGDAVLGLSSSGLHSNGYSLVRKLFFEILRYSPEDYIEEFGCSLGEELLKPTRIYVSAFMALKRKGVNIKGMAHITGGGLPGNLPRIIPDGLGAEIVESSWTVPPVFKLIKEKGKVSDKEMRRTFNMGIGFVFVVPDNEAEGALETLRGAGYESFLIGHIKGQIKGVSYV